MCVGLVNGQSGKKRKKQDAADLSQLGGMQANVGQAAASLPSHGSAPAQTGVLHLLESLLQVTHHFCSEQKSAVSKSNCIC